MSEPKTPYPPSPPDVPEGLTDYADSFARQQNRVLTGLFVFLIFYFAMIVLFAMVGVWCILALPGKHEVLKIVGVVLSATFFLFLVKGFFKRPAVNREMYSEITEDEHPVLFDFLHNLCEELGAPFPNRVYICPDVIAEFTVSTSLLNLFIEPKRELLLGMGLVNSTNLSEFKAILAHEFGHFCHLGRTKSYCAVAQRIVFDLIEGEDFFDRFLKKCKHNSETDSGGFQLKMLTWPIAYPVSWILEAGHAVLWIILKTVALPGRSMVWEQEYHADLVAVSAAGSDALTHSLVRARFGMQCFNQAIDELVKLAEEHDLYSNDLYLHQDRAAAIVRWKNQQPELGLPPALPEPTSGESIRVFNPEEDDYEDEHTPPMWRGHPTNAYREENAKEHFVPAVMDHRSPWILFDHVAELKEHMSYEFYRVVFHIRKNADFTEADTMQGYIDKEYPEISRTPRVQEFPQRLLESGELTVSNAVESISLVPVEEPIPVVSDPQPVAYEMPVAPATPVAPVIDELKGETVFDEVIRVVDADAPPADIVPEPDAPPIDAIVLHAPLAQQPPPEPPIHDVPEADGLVAFAEAVPAEAVPAEAVAEATPVAEPLPAIPAEPESEPAPAIAAAAEPEPIPLAVSEPVIMAEATNDASVVPEPEPEIEPEPALGHLLISEAFAALPASSLPDTLADDMGVPVLTEAVTDFVLAEAAPVPEPKPDAEIESPETATPIVAETLAEPSRIPVQVEAALAEPEPISDAEPAPLLVAEAEKTFSFDPESEMKPKPTPTPPIPDASVEDDSILTAEPVPEAAAVEPAPIVAPAPVAFGSANPSKFLDAIPIPMSEASDGSESEVFTLDEVGSVAAGEELLSLDADDSAAGDGKTAVSKTEASEPPDADDDSIYTLDANAAVKAPRSAQPPSDSLSKPMVKIGVAELASASPRPDTGATPAPRATFGSAAPKPDAGATPAPRPSFGSGAMPALVSCSVAETLVPAEGRRPAVRITFVKPGEKSPIGK